MVVEEVTPGFNADKAGLVPGDVILGWSRAASPPANAHAAEGRVETSFEIQDVEIEQAPRGPVTLLGRRGKAGATWTLPPDEWRLVVRPQIPAAILDPYLEGKRLIEAQKLEEGIALWERAARLAEQRGNRRLAGWLLLRAGEALEQAREWKRADELQGQAVERLDEGHSPTESTQALRSWALRLASRGALKDARERGARALDRMERSRGESLAAAAMLDTLGRTEIALAEYSLGEARHRQALALRERLAPSSVATADSLSRLGGLALIRHDLAAAEEYLTRALRIRESAAPGLAHALDLSTLATTAVQRGDYTTASERLSRALPVIERLAPLSAHLAYACHTSGTIAFFTGDLASAEHFFRRALHVYRQLPGAELAVGSVLRALSFLDWHRRDFDAAESHGREALAVVEAVASGTRDVREALHHLGDIALARGDLPSAEGQLRRALAISPAQDSDLITANDLRCLGLTLARSGRLEEAEQHAARSAEIRRRLVPGSVELSKSLEVLAEIASLQGRLASAEELYGEVLAIRTRLMPGSRDEAEAHHGLGRVHRRAGRPARAAECFERAIDALERQRARLGGTYEAKGSFSAAYARYYQDAIESLVELGRTGDAFHTLERSRARSLLALLAERDLLFRADLPADLARERQVNQVRYDGIQAELARLSPEQDAAEIERLVGRLRELRAESAEITARVREASPRLASLQYPEALDAAAARKVLDPGTLLLAFAVGERKTVLFAIRAEQGHEQTAPAVFTSNVGETELRERIESFRRLIGEPRSDQRELKTRAAELYDLLLRPVDALLASSKRVALSPDGPLHLLPFAALIRTGTTGRRTSTHWLAEWKPIHVVASASHYAELRRTRRESRPSGPRLVAFGDPGRATAESAAAPDSIQDLDLRSALARGFALAPLPHTRREVESIRALFGARATAFLGEEATEARAKAVPRDCSYVHFACHALLDPALPLNSALVLSIPEAAKEGQDNGLLQVWEIFDGVRLDADLVVLSGCETALGREMGGEGLIGLTRAFQYAGARAVLASQWRVSDRSTTDLMLRFYTYLQEGRSKVEALQAAQADLIRSGTTLAHPFRWAAFAVFGDWR